MTRTRGPGTNTALAAVGIATVGIAAAMVVAPGALAALLPVDAVARSTPLAERGGRTLAVALVGGGCLLWVVLSGAKADDATAPGRSDERRAVGRTFDRRFQRAADGGANRREREEVREALRSLAVDVVARTEGCSRASALEQVDSGEWTDDPVAAAYVAGELPLRRRLVAWVRPRRAVARRVERTVAALEASLDEGGES